MGVMATERQTTAPGGWAAVWRVIWEPGRVLAGQAERPTIAAPYVFGSLVGVISAVALAGPMTDLIMAQPAAFAPAGGQANPEQLEAMTGYIRYGSIAWLSLVFIAHPWFLGLITSLFLLLMGALRGGGVGFRQYMALAGYSAVPAFIGAALKAVLQSNALATVDSALPAVRQLQQLDQISLGLAALVPDANGALLALLQQTDLFDVWALGLLVLGFAAVHRIPASRAAYVGIVLLALRFGYTFVGIAMAS